MHEHLRRRPVRAAIFAILTGAAAACQASPEERLAANGIAPVYNERTGRLEQLLSDRDHDGTQETRAYMDGAVIKYIEIDRNNDGKPDRWEYYGPGTAPTDGGVQPQNVIDHAEEANGSDDRITRREFYAGGLIRRVTDDVDGDGRVDKWEEYDRGVLVRVELDLVGKGYPSQRLIYGPAGEMIRVETDPDGDGTFEPVRSGAEAR